MLQVGKSLAGCDRAFLASDFDVELAGLMDVSDLAFHAGIVGHNASLGALVHALTPSVCLKKGPGSPQMSNWDEALSATQVEYAACDAAAVLFFYWKLRPAVASVLEPNDRVRCLDESRRLLVALGTLELPPPGAPDNHRYVRLDVSKAPGYIALRAAGQGPPVHSAALSDTALGTVLVFDRHAVFPECTVAPDGDVVVLKGPREPAAPLVGPAPDGAPAPAPGHEPLDAVRSDAQPVKLDPLHALMRYGGCVRVLIA